MKTSAGCLTPMENAEEENRTGLNQDERIIYGKNKSSNTELLNKKRPSFLKGLKRDNEVSIPVPTCMSCWELSDSSVENTDDAGAVYQLSDHSTLESTDDQMTGSVEGKRTTTLSLSTSSLSRSNRSLVFLDNPSGYSSNSSMSSPTESRLNQPCPELLLSCKTPTDGSSVLLPEQGRDENNKSSNDSEKREEGCRRSIIVTNGQNRVAREIDNVRADLPHTSREEFKWSPNSEPQMHSQQFLDMFLPILKRKPVCFSTLASLEFDVFRVTTLSKPFCDIPLVVTTVAALHKLSTIERLKVSWLPVVKFLLYLENAYNDHPYHSSWHAADVVGTMAYFLSQDWFKRSLSPVHQLLGLISAASHDVNHDSRTNQFHRLAKTAIGTSHVESNMEHYHINVSEKILSRPGCNWTTELEKWDQTWTPQAVWKLFCTLILRTDPELHDIQKRKPFTTLAQWSKEEQNKSAEYALIEILHLADISNPAKPLGISTKWSVRFYDEFQALGKEVRRLHLNIPVFKDPEKMPSLPDTQVYFISSICLPTFEDLVTFMPDVQETVDNLNRNLKYWKSEKESLLKRKNLLAKWHLDVSHDYKGECKAVGLETPYMSENDLKESPVIKIIKGTSEPI